MNKKTRYVLLFVVAAFVLSPIIATLGYWEVPCTTYQTKSIPVVYYRLYDPAGTHSYQEITETFSTSLSMKFEAEVSGNKVSTSATVASSASTGVRTIDNNDDPTINGIGKGDVIHGRIFTYRVRIDYIYGINTWGTYTRDEHITLVSYNWNGEMFDYTPADFKARFGVDAPSKLGGAQPAGLMFTVSKGVAKTFTNSLKIETEQSISLGFEFPISGMTVKSKVTTTFKAGYELKVKTYIKDTVSSITQTMHYSGPYSGSVNILADSIIPWFTLYVPRYTPPLVI